MLSLLDYYTIIQTYGEEWKQYIELKSIVSWAFQFISYLNMAEKAKLSILDIKLIVMLKEQKIFILDIKFLRCW